MPRKSPERIPLTKRALDALTPGATVRDVFDTKLAGFHARVMPSGKITFALRYRDPKASDRRGTFHRLKVGEYGPMTVDQARKRAEDFRASVVKMENPATARVATRKALTVGEALPRFFAHLGRQKRSPKTVANYRTALERHGAALHPLKVQDVKRAHIAAVLADLRDTHPTQANRTRSAISSFLSWTVGEGLRLDDMNPAHRMPRELETRRGRALTQDERDTLAAVLAKADKLPWRAVGIVWLIAHTGLRREEATRLRWSEVDAAAGVFRLTDTKTGPSTRPTCGPTVAAKLREFRRLATEEGKTLGRIDLIESPFVFPGRDTGETWYRSLAQHWKTMHTRAGLMDVDGRRIHNLRHDFRTAINAIGQLAVNAAGGWKGTDMADRYHHFDADELLAISKKIDAIRAPQFSTPAMPTVLPIGAKQRRTRSA